MKKVKIGVLGTGRIGKLHTENLVYSVPGAEVTAVADPLLNGEIQAWAERLGIKKCFREPEKVIQDPEVEAVFICSSTDTHADLITKAAKAVSVLRMIWQTHP